MKLNEQEKKLIVAAMLIHENCTKHKGNCKDCLFELGNDYCLFTDYEPTDYDYAILRVLSGDRQ